MVLKVGKVGEEFPTNNNVPLERSEQRKWRGPGWIWWERNAETTPPRPDWRKACRRTIEMSKTCSTSVGYRHGAQFHVGILRELHLPIEVSLKIRAAINTFHGWNLSFNSLFSQSERSLIIHKAESSDGHCDLVRGCWLVGRWRGWRHPLRWNATWFRD